MHLQHYSVDFALFGREFRINNSEINRSYFVGDHFYYGPHMHGEYFDWIFVVEGKLRQVINGREYILGPGDLNWIRKGDWHEESGDRLRFFTLYGTVDWMESMMSLLQTGDAYRALLALPEPPLCHVPSKRQAAMARRWEECYNMHLTDLGKLYLTRMFSDVFIEYFLPLVAKTRKQNHFPDWLRRGLEFIETHVHEGVTSEQLAEACDKSPEYVARSFRRFLGTTPSHYINQQKLNYAAYLLCTTEHSILEISLMADFNTPSYFHRLFRRRFHCSPRAYRERHWKSVKDIKGG